MHKHTGFTLIEVLIALVVLASGLLGLAALQANGLRSNQTAYFRSQATQLAYDLADRFRSNLPARSTYATLAPASATSKTNCLTTTGCTPAAMAENDLFEWNNAVSNTLPNGSGSINYSNGFFTITLTWDENRDGTENDHSFQTQFQL